MSFQIIIKPEKWFIIDFERFINPLETAFDDILFNDRILSFREFEKRSLYTFNRINLYCLEEIEIYLFFFDVFGGTLTGFSSLKFHITSMNQTPFL